MWRARLPQGPLASASRSPAAGTTHPDLVPISRMLANLSGSSTLTGICSDQLRKQGLAVERYVHVIGGCQRQSMFSVLAASARRPILQFARVQPKRIKQAVKPERLMAACGLPEPCACIQ